MIKQLLAITTLLTCGAAGAQGLQAPTLRLDMEVRCFIENTKSANFRSETEMQKFSQALDLCVSMDRSPKLVKESLMAKIRRKEFGPAEELLAKERISKKVLIEATLIKELCSSNQYTDCPLSTSKETLGG